MSQSSRRAFLSTAAGAALAPYVQAQKRTKPNIIFILADDLGYGDLGCYGQQMIRTPRIDAMCRESLKFTQAYAGCTVCAPSRCTLMTGMHTGHAYIRGNRRPEIPLRPRDITVAEVLKKAGYTTGMYGKWGLGPACTGGVPNKKGFDHWFGYLDQVHAHNYWTDVLWDNEEEYFVQKNFSGKKQVYAQQLFTGHALDFIHRYKDRPFYLNMTYTTPHGPYDPPSDAPYTNESWPQPMKNLAAMITSLDTDVGRILDAVKQAGIDENTLVIFTSDNGGQPQAAKFFKSNGPLRGGKRDMYEGGVREPFLARWPGKIKPGESDQVLAFWDMLPTFAELAGGTPPAHIDGISMAPALLGKPQKNHDYLYWELYERGYQQAVRMGDWKGVRLAQAKPIELYNLRDDLAEQNNVAASHPEITAKIERIMTAAHSPSEYWPDRRANPPAETGG
jgi:arylsulfatase A-like enzyme